MSAPRPHRRMVGFRLLRSHVLRGPGYHPGPGQALRRPRPAWPGRSRRSWGLPIEIKAGDGGGRPPGGVAIGACGLRRFKEDVGRLEVAMDDAARRAPCGWPAPGSPPGRAASRGCGRAFQALRQGAAADPFQGQVGPPVAVADLVNPHDVGMLDAGRPARPRLESEPLRSRRGSPVRIILSATMRFSRRSRAL